MSSLLTTILLNSKFRGATCLVASALIHFVPDEINTILGGLCGLLGASKIITKEKEGNENE